MLLLSLGHIKLRSYPFLTILGALTYPLYLVHNVAGKIIIDRYSHLISEDILITLTTIGMVLISYCIYATIERPLADPLKRYLLKFADKLNITR
jgi:peptidoglycan/LPS O-acetylase OafA/YrhL